jgi:rhodanese-related sulfurtransferase
VTSLNLPWWWPFGRVADIAACELQARLQGSTPPQLIDVRSEIEWRSSRIAGAVNVPVTDLKARLAGLGLDPARPVVAICLTAHRSIPAVRILRAQGFDARQLRQGMRAWWRAGLPVERGSGRV